MAHPPRLRSDYLITSSAMLETRAQIAPSRPFVAGGGLACSRQLGAIAVRRPPSRRGRGSSAAFDQSSPFKANLMSVKTGPLGARLVPADFRACQQ